MQVHGVTHVKSWHRPPIVCAPKASAGAVEAYMLAAEVMNGARPAAELAKTVPSTYTMIGCAPGDEFRVDERLRVSVVACDHSVPCVGYVFHEVRRKLKPELAGRDPEHLKALRQQGAELHIEVLRPLFAFLGDTTTQGNRHPPSAASPSAAAR